MIACIENCKYQKNGECTYDKVLSNTNSFFYSNCAYFEQE